MARGIRSTRHTPAAPLIAALLVHVLLLGAPLWNIRLLLPERERERVIPLMRPEPPPMFGEASPEDDAASAIRQAPPPAPARRAAQPQPAQPPAAVAAPAAPAPPAPAAAAEPPELNAPAVAFNLPSPARVEAAATRTPSPRATPPRSPSPRPTKRVEQTAKQETARPTLRPTAATVRTEEQAKPAPTTPPAKGTPTPLPDLFKEFNQQRRQELAAAQAENGEDAVQDAVPGAYHVKSDGSLTIYVGKGRRGTRAEIDFGSHPPAAINQALAPFGGSYWQGYRDAVEVGPRARGGGMISGVVREGQRLRPVTRGGPGYYVLVNWGDEEKLGLALERMTNQALKDHNLPDDTPLRRVIIGVRLHEQRYQFYVQSLQPEAKGTTP